MWLACLIVLAAQFADGEFTSPTSAAEVGHNLTAAEAREGWIALYDGRSNYGWSDAETTDGILAGGETTSVLAAGRLKGEAVTGGLLTIGDRVLNISSGQFDQSLRIQKAGTIALGPAVRLKSLRLKPEGLKPVFNQQDLRNWTVLRHPTLPAERQTKWSVNGGILQATGGPGALEFKSVYADFILQVEVRTRARLVNGGVFFRAIPGEFLNGYEAQIFNACYQLDPSKPARYSTGAIDDRLLARRLVSRDLEPLTMTVIAVGPRIATWVNGYQMVDWIDLRDPHANPRQGQRLDAGAIQLQAHDAETDLEFHRIMISEIK